MTVKLGVGLNQKAKATQIQTSSLPNASQEIITITPDPGVMCKLNGVYINIPSTGGTLGHHEIDIYNGGVDPTSAMVLAAGLPTTTLTLNGFVITSGNGFSDLGTIKFLSNYYFNSDNPLKILYSNATNATNNNTRTYRVNYTQQVVSDF